MSLTSRPRVRIEHPHVVVNDDVNGGSPTVAGSRVPVRRLWAWHRGGTPVEMLFRRYPNLGQARILDALSFAYDHTELMEWDLEREKTLIEGRDKGPVQTTLPFQRKTDGKG